MSCSRLYTLKWAERQHLNMQRVGHRHSVFTMLEELRNFFSSKRELLKELDGTRQAVKYIGRYLNMESRTEAELNAKETLNYSYASWDEF